MVRHLGFGPFDDQPVVNCSFCLLIDGEKKKISRTHLSVVLWLYFYAVLFIIWWFKKKKKFCFLLELLEGKKIQGVNTRLGLFFFFMPITYHYFSAKNWWLVNWLSVKVDAALLNQLLSKLGFWIFRAAVIPRAKSGARLQMKLVYNQLAPLYLILLQWLDCSCTCLLPRYLNFFHILVYKVGSFNVSLL